MIENLCAQTSQMRVSRVGIERERELSENAVAQRARAAALDCSRLSRSPLFYRITLCNALAGGDWEQSRAVENISPSIWTGLYQ